MMKFLVITVTLSHIIGVSLGERIPFATAGGKTFYTLFESMESVSWLETVQGCAKEGLTTAIIENREEDEALAAAARKLIGQGKNNLLWLGAVLRSGQWVWAANGEKLTYIHWNEYALINVTSYDCGYMSGSPNGWNTWPCGDGSPGGELGVPVCQCQ